MPNIVGTWRRGEEPVRGTWRLVVPVRVTGFDGDEILPAGVYATGDLTTDVDDPSLSTHIISSAGTLPIGWKPVMRVEFFPGGSEEYVLDVSGTATIDLGAVLLPEQYADIPASLVRGVAGGIAGLDADGDVVDAAGHKVTGGGGSTATWDTLTGKPTAFPPSGHHSTHATGGTDPIAPADIGAATAVGLAGEVTRATEAEAANAAAIATETTRASTAEATKATTTALTTHIADTANPHAVTKAQVGLSNVNNTADTAKPVSTAQQAALDAKADLVGGFVPTSQIPSIALTTGQVVASRAALLALTNVQAGDIVVISGTADKGTYILTTADPATWGNWLLLNAPTDVVQTVNGQQGTVVLGAADIGALAVANNLSDVPSPSTARGNLGLGGSATRAVGTTTGTVAAGDDSRITGAAQKASNLSDLPSAATARTNLALGTSATRDVGTASGQVAAGNDSRITGAVQTGTNPASGVSVTTSGLIIVTHTDVQAALADLDAKAASNGLLTAPIVYNPITLASYSTTSATASDLDATNLSLPVTFPPTGKCLVTLNAVTSGQANWLLRNGSTVVTSASYQTQGGSSGVRVTAFFVVTGTAGATVTLKWAHSSQTGGVTTYVGGIAGPAFMLVQGSP